jgi:hypothetical protein
LCRQWGSPHLIPGEDRPAYDQLFAYVAATVRPADTIEEILLGNFVDLEWEIHRWRRLRASHMAAIAYKGLKKVLRSLSFVGAEQLVDKWAARKPRAVKQVDRILKTAGLNMDTVMAETLCEGLEDIKGIEAMIALAEARRNAALREIERHRATLACALQRALPQLEDAEYQAIDVADVKSAA